MTTDCMSAAVSRCRYLVAVSVCLFAITAGAGMYSWNTPPATVLPNGDLAWAPEPFVYTPGASIRYIDFENGNNANAGASTNAPWKHHPWDPNATGNAASGGGQHTYVFKRGVNYRGRLVPAQSGTAGNPIRLTSDPNWGEGEACLYGSEVVTGWQQGPTGVNVYIPSPGSVWYKDLNYLPRTLYMLDATGAVTRLALARQPNWTITDPLDPYRNCWRWSANGATTNLGSSKILGTSTQLTNPDPNYYTGGLVWTEWSNLMGAPYAAQIEARDAARNAVAFAGPWDSTSYNLIINQRFWLEDKPHYLDQAGEFWFERTGSSAGRLYVRLPGDIAPTNSGITIEAGRHMAMVYKYLGTLNHVDISGLTFRFGNVYWPLEYRDFRDYPSVVSAAVHFEGTGMGLSVRNCRFEHVAQAVRFRAYQAGQFLSGIIIADNDIQYCDRGAISVIDGGSSAKPGGVVSVRVLRNRIRNTGLRPARVNGHHTVHIGYAQQAEVAGNMLDLVGGAGLFLFGGKASVSSSVTPYDAPFTRFLVHHNNARHTLLAANDWGGIETWQGGTFYVYNNVSWNPIARQNYSINRFGGAYYLDGSFKNYCFNNIAWGGPAWVLNKDVVAPQAFQEIIGYNNTIANNSAYRFKLLSRRQSADAGRNKYLGNMLDDNASYVFDHAPSGSTPSYDTLVYDYNVVTRVSNNFGRFEYGGANYASLSAFAGALAARQAMRANVGVQTNGLIFEDALSGDFRPRAAAPAINYGVRHFVPWALFTPVGEWHFVRNNLTPGTVIDESFYQHHGYLGRETYLNEMTFPLVGVNIGAGNYVAGPLEDWCDGAVRLNGVDQHYAANGNGPYNKSLDIGTNSFILEAYVRTDPGHVGGVLAAKTAAQGYTLQINNAGHAQFIVRHGGVDVFTQASGMQVNDGDWHHILVEYRRPAAQISMYIDGVPASGVASGTAPAAGVWITNSAAFLVGKGPAGNYFAGEIEFLRVSRGALADAATTIEELYDWQFGGPMLADFRSVPPSGRRDAGALELAYVGEALPRITRQPTNIVLELGMAGGARVAALNGTAYAWSKDAAPHHASTNTALAFTTTQTGDAGVYVLTVSNSAGAATSAPIVVSVIPEPFSMLWLAGCICMARRIGVAT